MMPRRRLARALLALAALPFLASTSAPPIIIADCAMPPPLEEAVKSADIVFVGTVVSTQSLNRWASVTVEEVWRGPDQPEGVVVRGGTGDAGMMSSVDRTFETGVKYLFFPYAAENGGLADNSCTSTRQWGDDLLALRPADARTPTASTSAESGFDLSGVLGPLAVALVVGLALFGVGLLARGRQSA